MCNDVPEAGQLLITMPAAHRDTPSLFFLAGTRFSFLESLGLIPAVHSQCGFPQAEFLWMAVRPWHTPPSWSEDACG